MKKKKKKHQPKEPTKGNVRIGTDSSMTTSRHATFFPFQTHKGRYMFIHMRKVGRWMLLFQVRLEAYLKNTIQFVCFSFYSSKEFISIEKHYIEKPYNCLKRHISTNASCENLWKECFCILKAACKWYAIVSCLYPIKFITSKLQNHGINSKAGLTLFLKKMD